MRRCFGLVAFPEASLAERFRAAQVQSRARGSCVAERTLDGFCAVRYRVLGEAKEDSKSWLWNRLQGSA